MYKIEIVESADKLLRTLPKSIKQRIVEKISDLSNMPRPIGSSV